MTEKVFADALAQAQKELDELMTQKFSIDARIARLKNTIEALTQHLSPDLDFEDIALRTTGSAFDESTGITAAIREVMGASKLPLTAPQIRDALEARGYDVNQYSSILTVIHNTIKRMHKQGEVTEVRSGTGTFVGWMSTPRVLQHVEAVVNTGGPSDTMSVLSQVGSDLETFKQRTGIDGRQPRKTIGQRIGERIDEGNKRIADGEPLKSLVPRKSKDSK